MDAESLNFCEEVISQVDTDINTLNDIYKNKDVSINTLKFVNVQIEALKLRRFYYINLKRIEQIKTSQKYIEFMKSILVKLIKYQDELKSITCDDISDLINIKSIDEIKETYEIQYKFLNDLDTVITDELKNNYKK